jgi:hypothetical protein
MSSGKNIILRIGLVYKNPTKVQLNHLTSTLFTSKNTLIKNSLCIGYEDSIPDYQSDVWLKNVDIVNKLSILDYSDLINLSTAKYLN